MAKQKNFVWGALTLALTLMLSIIGLSGKNDYRLFSTLLVGTALCLIFAGCLSGYVTKPRLGVTEVLGRWAAMLLFVSGVILVLGIWFRPERPHVEMRFYLSSDLGEKRSLHFCFYNPSSKIAHNPKDSLGITDLNNPYYYPNVRIPQPLPIPIEVHMGDSVLPRRLLGSKAVLNQPSLAHVRDGDRLFGFASASCSDCFQIHSYWVYYEVGGQGWYAPIPEGQEEMPIIMKYSDEEISNYVDGLLPLSKRIAFPTETSCTP
jgi:hypothetical protein